MAPRTLLCLVLLLSAATLCCQAFLFPAAPSDLTRPTPTTTTTMMTTTCRPLISSSSNSKMIMHMSSSMDEPMILTEENAEAVLQMARQELSTMFGYLDENKAIGITGEVDFVGIDGISIIVRLRNRFWHDRKMVLARVSKFITDRIPEAQVEIEDPKQLLGGNDDEKSVEEFYRSELGK